MLFRSAIYIAQYILNPNGRNDQSFSGGNGTVNLSNQDGISVISLNNDQLISGFQIDLEVDSRFSLEELNTLEGWILKTRHDQNHLRIIGIDFSGSNGRNEIQLSFPGKINAIQKIGACNPMGKEITFTQESSTDLIEIPGNVSIGQLYPNPFNPVISIPISLPYEMDTRIQVFDIQGRHVATLLNENHMVAGNHIINWNANDFASGVYFIQIQTSAGVDVRKAYLVK